MSATANQTPAEEEFNTSSKFPYSGERWVINNSYPRSEHLDSTSTSPNETKPWLDIDFKKEPKRYAEAIEQYFHEGNVENDFIVQKNPFRPWYHAAWLHYGKNGREPVNGLNYGGTIEPRYISKDQDRYLQGWLCSYFNKEAATVLGDIWHDPNEPKWESNLHFPPGSLICENVFADVTEKQVSFVKDAPVVYACIAQPPDDPNEKPDPSKRLETPRLLRLIQSDFAARDSRSPTGWVFGTFIHDNTKTNPDTNPWNNLIPVGVEWGNDPSLDQKAHDEGKSSTECWINTRTLDIINSLKGERPWLGWHGRLNGPADNFISTCTSCHAVAQLTPADKRPTSWTQLPEPKKIPAEPGRPGVWVQDDDAAIKRWFRNVESGEPFDPEPGYLSADYNRHVQFGYENYVEWRQKLTDTTTGGAASGQRIDISTTTPRAGRFYSSD